jgi:hypothetical protein
LPAWLTRIGGGFIALHLFAVLILALAAPSGPWLTPFGSSLAEGPAFAEGIGRVAARYLGPLKLAHNFHFTGNRPAAPGVYFEVRLRDAAGKHLRTVRVPEEGANFWVRHRQVLLAQALVDDQPVQPRAGELVAAPNKAVESVPIWDLDGERKLRLRPVAEHLIPRDRPVARPSGWSVVLARSYVRYLCRQNGAAGGELVRHTREAVLPAVMFDDDTPAGAFEELVANFGEEPK